jgi:perosamine synthetase
LKTTEWIPYSRQDLDEDDIGAVVEVLRSDFLTTGPQVEAFEERFAHFVGAAHAVAVSSGTAALHCAIHAAGVGPGDEVLVPAMTFTATAASVLHCGATPVFVDVCADTLLVDPAAAARRVTPRTRALIAVDYAGQACDYLSLREIAAEHGLVLLADACHALGASLHGRKVGSVADLTAFSLHPVKPATCGEGGVITTDSAQWAERMRRFRNHGIDQDHRRRRGWSYDVLEIGFNYRLTDFQCALAASQLRKCEERRQRREQIARSYREVLDGRGPLLPLEVLPSRVHAWHLFVIRCDSPGLGFTRDELYRQLSQRGIGTAVHYRPVHLHPAYRKKLGTGPGLCPVAEEVSQQILSLPIHSAMTDEQLERVLSTLGELCRMSPAHPEDRGTMAG